MLARCTLFVLFLAAPLSIADAHPLPQQPEAKEEAPAPELPQVVDGKVTLRGIEFQVGPCKGELGSVASVDVPEGFLFTGRQGTVKFMTMNQNPTGDSEVGTVLSPDGDWFVVFSHEDSGHVSDDEKDDLDADDLLKTLKEGTEYGNQERKRRGWEPLEIVGWHRPPFYDPKTNNLTWSTLLRSASHENLNWTTKLLGRTSTMTVDLVCGADVIDAAIPQFEQLIAGFQYQEGHRYAEFRSGDKVAEYGLTALVAGGAGVVAAKTGLLAKFWKFIVAGLVAIGAFFKRLFGFGKKDANETASS